jgi:site-specific recombinase XerD
MASIYRRSRDKGKKNRPYVIQYFDHEGKRRIAKGFTDKGLTEQLAAKLENEVLLRRRGMIDPVQERLLAIRQSPIGEHLAAFERSLSNSTPKHRKLTMTRVRRLVEASGSRTIGDLDAEKVEEALKAIRAEEDLGARTYNHYLQAVDEFGKWLVASKRLLQNPVAGIERLNAETDVRHKRRSLSPEEVSRLVDSARSSGEDVQGYPGELRARAYLMSFFTGLRRQELASLTPRSFRLDDPRPKLVVEAACSKHRRKDTLPMHPELVLLVREWIADMDADTPLFPRLDRKKTWLMVKKDLERIGIPYETPDGIADFHAAGRHSHITGLVRHGATLVEAKELARHADVRQTMKYTHIGLEDQAQALAGLPAPFASADPDGLHYGCNSGGALGQELSPDDSRDNRSDSPENEQAPAGPGLASSVVTNRHQLTVCGSMEAAGIAPASRDPSVTASTCVAARGIVGRGALGGKVPISLAHHEFNPSRNGRLGSGDPALSTSGRSRGRRPAAKPLDLLSGSHAERGSPLGKYGLVGFLRGPLTNLGTPPVTSVIRSILVRPRIVKEVRAQRTMILFCSTSRESRGFAPEPISPSTLDVKLSGSRAYG